MSYCLHNGFLYESSTYTTLKFVESDSFSVENETNTRTVIINFKTGTTVDRLKTIPGFKVLKENNILSPGVFFVRKEKLKIGPLTYYFKNGVSRFSQLYNTVLDNMVLEYDGMVFVSINRDNAPSNEDYIKLINDSTHIYCEDASDGDFEIYNYYNIDISKGEIDPSEDESCTSFSYLGVSATDTNSSFLDHCQSHYPDVEIVTEFSDLSKLRNNVNGYLVVKFGLPNWQGGEFNTHLFTEWDPNFPEYGKYMVSNTRGFLEYITADWDKYLEMRYDFLMLRKLYQHNEFPVVAPSGAKISAMVDFDSGIDDNIDRNPQERSVDSSKLYSLKINFTIYSYIIENYLAYPLVNTLINKIIANVRVPGGDIANQFVMEPEKPTRVIDEPKETPPYAEYEGDVWP